MNRVAEIIELQNQSVDRWHREEINNPFPPTSLQAKVCTQHQFNYLLWHEEDIARSPDVPDSEIARVKRSIDRLNQQRNDWIEKVDDHLSDLLAASNVKPQESAKLNTETPGAAIDRLSILALRIYHLREQLERPDATQDHRQSVRNKLAICELQQHELANALQELLDDLWAGRKRHRTYRQLKMYNDPTLNPFLYRSRGESAVQTGI